MKEAYALQDENKLAEALSKFEEAFASSVGAANYFDAAAVAAQVDDAQKAFNSLQKSADLGWSQLEYSHRKPTLRSVTPRRKMGNLH